MKFAGPMIPQLFLLKPVNLHIEFFFSNDESDLFLRLLGPEDGTGEENLVDFGK